MAASDVQSVDLRGKGLVRVCRPKRIAWPDPVT